jgi:hypothetical protein
MAINYNSLHYTQLFKRKMPFLYDYDELSQVPLEDRDDAFEIALANRSRFHSADAEG